LPSAFSEPQALLTKFAIKIPCFRAVQCPGMKMKSAENSGLRKNRGNSKNPWEREKLSFSKYMFKKHVKSLANK
jgi:hypothetical protein